MARDLFTSNQVSDVTIMLLESNSAVLHFLFDCFLPQMISILLVCFQGFFPGLGDSEAMFVGLLETFGFHLVNDSFSLLVDMWQPPSKSWLILEVI